MLNSAVGRVRLVGLVEACSFLVLLFVAMPLKYIAEKPEAVRYVGWAHGVLFMAYAGVTLGAWGVGALSARLVGFAALASILPFGPFLLDHRLKSVEHRKFTPPGE